MPESFIMHIVGQSFSDLLHDHVKIYEGHGLPSNFVPRTLHACGTNM